MKSKLLHLGGLLRSDSVLTRSLLCTDLFPAGNQVLCSCELVMILYRNRWLMTLCAILKHCIQLKLNHTQFDIAIISGAI